jgi:hypothetical protein
MRRPPFLTALAASLCTAGCNDVPAAQSYATVFGRVYDAATNGGVAGVTVSADTALIATTGPDGTYSISPVPSGQTDVLVTPPPGYSVSAQPSAFSVNNGDRIRMDIPLERG